MKYAIIAAGEGSRLAQEGVSAPKPLVQVGGECLIDRLLRIFMQNSAEEQNGLFGLNIPLRVVVKSTPSSMHSFFELSQFLDDGPFCLTTVDTIFREGEFADYMAFFRHAVEEDKAAGVMGVTDYIDDEKPLYVGVGKQMEISGFYDQSHDCKFISGGIYGLTPVCVETLRACIRRGDSRMRNFQRALVADGLHLMAYPFSKVLDIDHATDIAKAEQFIADR